MNYITGNLSRENDLVFVLLSCSNCISAVKRDVICCIYEKNASPLVPKTDESKCRCRLTKGLQFCFCYRRNDVSELSLKPSYLKQRVRLNRICSDDSNATTEKTSPNFVNRSHIKVFKTPSEIYWE